MSLSPAQVHSQGYGALLCTVASPQPVSPQPPHHLPSSFSSDISEHLLGPSHRELSTQQRKRKEHNSSQHRCKELTGFSH